MGDGTPKFTEKSWNHAPGEGVSQENWDRIFGKKRQGLTQEQADEDTELDDDLREWLRAMADKKLRQRP